MASERSLKSQNVKWLVMLAALDTSIVLLLVFPELISSASPTQINIARGLAAGVAPVAVLLLTSAMSHDIKAKLVYWKLKNVLPGSHAFTKHGPADGRIDMIQLKKNVGQLPSEPSEQNSKWYKLYQLVRNDSAVEESHKLYLLFRDMAAMSLLLAPLAPAALYCAGAAPNEQWLSACILVVQYFICAAAARNNGNRFICNVLAIHASKKI
jgi:hypothetical protein